MNVLYDYVSRVKNWWDYLLLIRRTMPHCLLQSPRLPRLDWPGPISPLNYLITKSRWYPWIILSPYHAGIFELSWHQIMLVYPHTIELSTTIDLSITKSSSYLIISYHRPIRALPLRVPWSIFSIQSLHASTLVISLSPHQGQMYKASVAGPQDWLHFLCLVCVHCFTVILSVFTTVYATVC